MDFPVWLNRFIIGNRYLRYHPIWCWYKLINHQDYRLDDRFVYQDFWNSINFGQTQMVEDAKWLEYFGAKPETILLSVEDYDTLVARLNEPPDPKVVERFREIMNKPAPWEEE
jgi:hypothetical protein